MKNLIWIKLLTRLKSHPHWTKEFKVFAVAGVVAFLILGGFGIWLGISAVGHVSEIARISTSSEKIEALKRSVTERSTFAFQECWQEAKSLFRLQPWMERPIGQNVLDLKTVCLEGQAPCDGLSCENRVNTNDEKGGVRT